MRRPSLLTVLLIMAITIAVRFIHIDFSNREKPLMVTSWDALGYYLYLPSALMYHDMIQLDWFHELDARYALSGGDLYQAREQEDGGRIFKYLCGVAVLELPFFAIGHLAATITEAPPNGFSAPYQYAIAFGAIFYLLIALLLLRSVLLRYFDETTTSLTLLLTLLASNAVQYFAVQAGQSHSFIFFLYAAVLYTTVRWHEKPRLLWAVLTAFFIGLAVIGRPTEIVIIFIPLLWDTHSPLSAYKKWALVKQFRHHLPWMLLAGLIAISPQVAYWKHATGHFFHAHGSKWNFLNPHWKVLFGWEKGWFIYTPVTAMFILGILFSRRKPFFWPLITTGLMTIWIVIAWHDWRYGGSYSSRAMVQSYPLFALAMAALIQRLSNNWLKTAGLAVITGWLIFVNLFQVWQYNRMIIHYDHMNRKYYQAVFLDPSPSPADMSLLDLNSVPGSLEDYADKEYWNLSGELPVVLGSNDTLVIDTISLYRNSGDWLKVSADIHVHEGIWESYLEVARIADRDSTRHRVRLHSPISMYLDNTEYCFFIPAQETGQATLVLRLYSTIPLEATIKDMRISLLEQH